MFEFNVDLALKYLVTLFSIINPLGVIPIFMAMTREFSEQEIHSVSRTCSLAVVITLLTSLFLGTYILKFFQISIPSFTIGGGILLFTMAFGMISAKISSSKINPQELKEQEKETRKQIAITPLAIPLLSGPGSISVSIIHSQTFTHISEWAMAAIGIVIIGLFLNWLLHSSKIIGPKLGIMGMNVMTRIMGIILLAMSIEMISTGIFKELIPSLAK